ncbi:Uncharacterised protein [Serratia fonticola]|uniref:Uncharacterized protein n=1 Tax=Serratia fonticola TaxID=47917 RepID=A0A3S4X580_SERFO|nr:Uncharacterised protein [Serratia fonticola]
MDLIAVELTPEAFAPYGNVLQIEGRPFSILMVVKQNDIMTLPM